MSPKLPGLATLVIAALSLLAAAVACGEARDGFEPPPAPFDFLDAGTGECPFQCSLDGRSVTRSCTGEVVETCRADLACGAAKCQDPCAAAAADKSSNGCEFLFTSPVPFREAADSCYAVFVVNASTHPAEISLGRQGEALDISRAMFQTVSGDATLIPHTGTVAPGESVILFVSGPDPERPVSGDYHMPCPSGVVPAVLSGLASERSEIGSAFHLTSNQPVTLVAMYPFGGAKSYIPTASLLLPVVTWAKEQLLVSPWEATTVATPNTQIVASEDDTDVTIVPTRDLQDGPGLEGVPANVPATYRLAKGQYLQLVQFEELSGTVVSSNKPTTVFAGHTCVTIPTSSSACDTLWQQLPAFEQWGSEYVGIGPRSRYGDEHEPMPYRIAAAKDGTRLEYDPAIPAGAPTELSAGEVATFPAGTGDAFVVRSQDAEHPIYLAAYMTSARGGYHAPPRETLNDVWGDPEFVNVIPTGQYLSSYSFYADPTFAETSLVVVRAKSHGVFKDVWLECAGNLTDFRPVGTRGDYEFTRVDLTRGRGPGQAFGDKTCLSGVHRMRSEGPFTATVWGWDRWASYAYPGGMAHRTLVTSPLVVVQ
ncbi:MAG: hypothetical protein BGO98_07930 [Myxococcales bacterium 68-20]|nr:MAG: hypothetical protein BGO98_07930 [Myxococcales bacterium 68-20]